MREELETLVQELKKLKQQGVSSVLMEPDTLDTLEAKAKQLAKASDSETKHSQTEVTESNSSVAVEKKHPETLSFKEEQTPAEPPQDFHKIPEFTLPEGNKQEQWQWLQQKVLKCPVCNNHVLPGKKVVFGVGSVDADIFFCGEAPGAEEEVKGEPFVGPAGQLLTKIIQAMGLQRSDVYIGNIMNWRPETDTPYGNRPPTPAEMEFCLPYLKAQLEIVQPKVIVALGATAVNGLLGYDTKRSITRSHGEWHQFQDVPTIISFHPSYILRNGTNRVKRMIWEDMLEVMKKLNMPISDRQENFFK